MSMTSISAFANEEGICAWLTTEKMMVSSFGAWPHQFSLRTRVTTSPVWSMSPTLKGP